MPLPDNFHFNQNNLQDFVDCPRRFELRYILRQQWPAVQTEPVLEQERHMRMGSRFHEFIRQFFSGLPSDLIEEQIDQPELMDWWHAFLSYSSSIPSSPSRWAEHTLSMNCANSRLIAKYDLVILTPDDHLIIYDWKTNPRRPTPRYLRQRLQTRLYPFLITSVLHPANILTQIPENVTMIYWFAAFPNDVEKLPYTQSQFDEDYRYLSGLIRQIQLTPDGQFLLTQEEKACGFCTYRSLCDRGRTAGRFEEIEDTGSDSYSPIDINFDQILEIEF